MRLGQHCSYLYLGITRTEAFFMASSASYLDVRSMIFSRSIMFLLFTIYEYHILSMHSWTKRCVNVVLGWHVQAMDETLNEQPFFHAVVGACCNVFLESLPSFRNGFIWQLLKSRDFALEGIGFAHWKILCQECIGASFPCIEVYFVGVKPHLLLA